MCWVILCVCEGKTTIAHWVSFLTHQLRWYCVTGVSLGIRKISLFQNQFNFVSSGHLSFQRLGFLTLNLKMLSPTYSYSFPSAGFPPLPHTSCWASEQREREEVLGNRARGAAQRPGPQVDPPIPRACDTKLPTALFASITSSPHR